MLTETQVIDILKALGDPNRLNLFELLLSSDRTNSELMEQTGLRQNLLSHHLNILTESGLVQMRQSIGDARRHYYSIDLTVVNAFKDWWVNHSVPDFDTLPTLRRPRKVLFLCLRNASRSMIAETLARHLAPQSIIAHSAGMEPGGEIPDITYEVLAGLGAPVSYFKTKMVDAVLQTKFDYLITVCDIVHEDSIPAAFAGVPYAHWSLRDPLEDGMDPEEHARLTRALCDEIKRRLLYLLQQWALEEAEA